MEFTIHLQILGIVLVTGIVMGVVANKTNFCTMGAVSDWVNMGDTGRLRAWLLEQQDSRGRWKMEYDLSGKTLAELGEKGQPSKWVTLRALRFLKAADAFK